MVDEHETETTSGAGSAFYAECPYDSAVAVDLDANDHCMMADECAEGELFDMACDFRPPIEERERSYCKLCCEPMVWVGEQDRFVCRNKGCKAKELGG